MEGEIPSWISIGFGGFGSLCGLAAFLHGRSRDYTGDLKDMRMDYEAKIDTVRTYASSRAHEMSNLIHKINGDTNGRIDILAPQVVTRGELSQALERLEALLIQHADRSDMQMKTLNERLDKFAFKT